ncbi:hypothetical protein KC19_2G143100 [Ceratodon purpureus]|uniref:LRAT domain-containing protein n=1 Tax=Ceratodon purpureus TaxID=3225 RepID=A0A8T0IWC8_CERPU|nr:hypothetical protein KC19_2G143100 [Ceratodon purpureus]
MAICRITAVFSNGQLLGGFTRTTMPWSFTVQHSSFRSTFVPFSSSTSSCSNKQMIYWRGLCGRQPFCYKGMRSSAVGKPDSSDKKVEKTTENPQVSRENQLLRTNQSSPPGRLARSELIEVWSVKLQFLLDYMKANRGWNRRKQSSFKQIRKIEAPKKNWFDSDFDPVDAIQVIQDKSKVVFVFGKGMVTGLVSTMKNILDGVREEIQRKQKSQEKEKKQKIAVLNHSWMSTEVPTQRLQLVLKEQLAVGETVFYRDHNSANGDGCWYHGIWDGDAVIHVKMPRCNCANCLRKGITYFPQCENIALGKPMFHQGIYDEKGYVYHFADEREKTDCDYEKCEECVARGTRQRRLNLKARGLGPSGVRKSCLSCFSEGARIDLVAKNKEVNLVQRTARLLRILWKISPFSKKAQSNREITKYEANCLQRRENRVTARLWKKIKRPEAEEVVNKAKKFYEDDSFGVYSHLTLGVPHNCESFSYYCKTGVYGSPQVTSALHEISLETRIGNSLREVIVFLMGKRMISKAKEKADSANRRHPELVPSALVPAEVYIERKPL